MLHWQLINSRQKRFGNYTNYSINFSSNGHPPNRIPMRFHAGVYDFPAEFLLPRRGEGRGIEATKLATAKKMLAMELELDIIAQVTGFSVEALKDMKQS